MLKLQQRRDSSPSAKLEPVSMQAGRKQKKQKQLVTALIEEALPRLAINSKTLTAR